MSDLSILIPARNEMFLKRTIDDILANIEGNTDIIAVLDGVWAEPPIPQNERITLVHYNQSIGQRAATNVAAKLSNAKYVMKCDAHCSFDKGFDIKMMNEMHDDWTMVPLMKNLHAFDWVCPDGHRRYQGPSGPCMECGKETVRDVVWIAKDSPKSVSYCFDPVPHFQYFGEYSHRPEGQGEITETMSLQGSCWMLTRDKYWELQVCDENFGSWGSQGIEVAVKTWLSGGRVVCNQKTWYAHMFRTQGGDFGFPYPISGSTQERARAYARDLFLGDKWPQQVHPMSWLIEKFWPVRDWTEADLAKLKANTFKFSAKLLKTSAAESEPEESLPRTERYRGEPVSDEPTKGIIFYTDNQLNLKIGHAVQKNLKEIGKTKHIPIVSASLKRMTFGDKNIHFPHLRRGYLSMFKQILGALENSDSDIIFFCEHDVLYSPSHFDFTPPTKDAYYYNLNVWKVDAKTGRALRVDDCKQLSGLCGYRDLLIGHYRRRIEKILQNQKDMLEKTGKIKNEGFSRHMGFEPGCHSVPRGVDNYKALTWESEVPIVDIRHSTNLTANRWSKKEFRDQKYTKGWKMAKTIPGWGKTADLIKRF